MPQGRMVRQDDSTAEQLRLTANKAASPQLVNALTSDEGPLPNGALPSIKVASEQGTKNLFSALDDDNNAMTKPQKMKKPKSEAVEITPKTWKEFGPQNLFIPLSCLLNNATKIGATIRNQTGSAL